MHMFDLVYSFVFLVLLISATKVRRPVQKKAFEDLERKIQFSKN